MKYAVISIKGNQYKVEEGKEYLVDKLTDKKPAIETLLVVNGEKTSIGNPTVKNAVIKYKIVAEEEKGKKLTIQKYKAKSRYRRKYGFRPKHTRLLIEKISVK